MPVQIKKITAELEPSPDRGGGYLHFTLKVDLHNGRPPLFTRQTFPVNEFQSNMKIFINIMVQEIQRRLEDVFQMERREGT